MRKILFLFFILISTLSANNLFDKIENFIGKEQFAIHNNLINLLFKTKNDFYIADERFDYYKILNTLKTNGLLHLKFEKPKELSIEFTTNTDAIKSLKVINETLRSMGYYYYFTKSTIFNKASGQLVWTIIFKTEYNLDPLLLIQEFKSKGCGILNIEKVNKTFWRYSLDVINVKIKEAIKIDNNERVVLQKPLRPYLLEVKNATKLRVIGRTLNHWFPYIAFYDKHLNVLKVIKKNRVYRGYRVNVPHGTKYIKISDLYTLINIKRGLSIIVK